MKKGVEDFFIIKIHLYWVKGLGCFHWCLLRINTPSFFITEIISISVIPESQAEN